jgi:hypothetical protein
VITPFSSRTAFETDTASTGSRSSSTSRSASGARAASSGPKRPPRRIERRTAISIAVGLLAIALAVVIATRDDAATADATARLVPPDALLYAHLSTSEGRTQDTRLLAYAGRFSAVRDRLPALGMALTPAAGGLDYGRDVRPWLGDEVALALLDGGSAGPEPMLLAEVTDRSGARRALDKLGARPSGSHAGTELLSLPPRATAAFTGKHLVIGPQQAVTGALDRARKGGPPSLADTRVFRRAATERDDAASLELFAPLAGLRRLSDGASGLAGAAGRMLLSPRLQGIHAQVAAEERGLKVTARVLRAQGGGAPAAFEPTLTDRVPSDAAGMLALPGLDALQAVAERSGGAPLIQGLEKALPSAAGIELEDLLAPLGEEAVVSIREGETAPVVTLAARTSDASSTKESLARLQGPVSQRLGAGPFGVKELDGTDVFSLRVTPELEPSYAVSKDAVVASTAGSGMDQLRPARSPATDAPVLEELMPGEGEKVEALGFLDPRKLLALGERTGLRAFSSPAARDDLGRIRAVGAVVSEDANQPTDTTAELFLEIP